MALTHEVTARRRLETPLVASSEQKRAFAAALLRARKAQGLSQEALAEHVLGTRRSQPMVSAWEGAKHEPEPERVFALERELAVEPGSLSRHLGYVPVGVIPGNHDVDVIASITADPMLSRDARKRLIGLYKLEVESADSSAAS